MSTRRLALRSFGLSMSRTLANQPSLGFGLCWQWSKTCKPIELQVMLDLFDYLKVPGLNILTMRNGVSNLLFWGKK